MRKLTALDAVVNDRAMAFFHYRLIYNVKGG